jgi:hypothetical protein
MGANHGWNKWYFFSNQSPAAFWSCVIDIKIWTRKGDTIFMNSTITHQHLDRKIAKTSRYWWKALGKCVLESEACAKCQIESRADIEFQMVRIEVISGFKLAAELVPGAFMDMETTYIRRLVSTFISAFIGSAG